MNIVIFGLSVSSSWGNGHASIWRGLIGSILRMGHHVTFFEQDVPYYAANRDLHELPPGGRLVLYPSWAQVQPAARAALDEADVAMVTSYCPDGLAASALVLDSAAAVRCFYDLDTPVTLSRLQAGESVDYLPPQGLSDFDLVLSYTGGPALTALRTILGARRAVPIYGCVDPAQHQPAVPQAQYRSLLSYLGTYAPDRQHAVERLFLEPARRLPESRLLLAGAQYPETVSFPPNVQRVVHLAPPDHPAFYCSSRLTLNVTRGAMAAMGWCPSGRLFEAAACGVPILSDWFDGLSDFFQPGEEILIANSTEDAMAALGQDQAQLDAIARRAQERTLAMHTADRRAAEMIRAFETSVSEVA